MKIKMNGFDTPCFLAKYSDHEEMGLEVLVPQLGKFETVFVKDPSLGAWSDLTGLVSEREYDNMYSQIKPFLVRLERITKYL
ncbi:hypothetical protein [Sulfuracidifex metallicus]|uniref:hypothetical protein n=1 Tax=Sulfuracidifex metallicus TaxID=47303 RepID=UPI00227254FD|nr:hypothetical protein [Sulfuracidifex metallicus]MCY0851046.1 hypothetical protein [Sulfuracidifex metallicus]